MLRSQLVLDQGAHAAGCSFRTQGQQLTVQAVGEGVHLLFDDVGHLADCPLEQGRRLDDRQADRLVAVAF